MLDPAPSAADDLGDFYLDIFGQQPGLKIYTQICLCFPLVDASSRSAIIDTLTEGLERLSAKFPWIAGQIVNEGASEGNSGVFKIVPLERTPRFVAKDLRNDVSVPTMEDLRRANFPAHMLDETLICPRMTIPGTRGDSVSDWPVFALQANFISGGLLLAFVTSHQAMDMTGQGVVMDLLSKACRKDSFTSEELSSGNVARRDIIPLLDDSYEPGSDVGHQIVKPPPSQPASNDTEPPSSPKSTWAYFVISPISLPTLKSLATEALPPSSGYVSTDDVVSAFIWQGVTRARLLRLSPTTPTTFARAIDPRRYLGLSPAYPGLVQNMAYNKSTLNELVKEPLGVVASQLRSVVDPKTSTLGHNTRALATLLHRSPDKSIVSVTAALEVSTDIMLSSWAKVDCYELDFSLGLGKPEAVRRPQFIPVESLMYLMPKTPDGEFAALICLRDEDMQRLKEDEDFAKYATYIG